MKKELEEKLEKNLHWQKKLQAEERYLRKELAKFDPVPEKKKFKKIVNEETPAN